ncbi:carbohydrate kinase family protein [Mycoplasmatota bacterium]|nr:carbohydrate kinase family protein [Mycoplasmatota bacterium]
MNNNCILCIGACNIDYKFKAKSKMIKKTSNPVDSKMSYGGVIRNVGENLSRLKQNVSLMTMVGDDLLGDKLRLDLKEYMDISLVDRISHQSTGQYYAVMNINGDMDIAYANMSIYDRMNQEWIQRHASDLMNYQQVIVDLNVQKSGLVKLIDLSRSKAFPLTVIGVSGPKMKNLPDDIIDLNLIIVNKDESQAYFNTDEEDSMILCDMWLKKGVKQVVITSGKQKVSFGDKEGIYSLPVIKVPQERTVDVTGAGDAFSSGVILALMENKKLRDAVFYGMVNASMTIQCEDSVRKNMNYHQFIQEVNENEKLFGYKK